MPDINVKHDDRLFRTPHLAWLSNWAARNLNERQIVQLGEDLEPVGADRGFFIASTLTRQTAYLSTIQRELSKPENLPN